MNLRTRLTNYGCVVIDENNNIILTLATEDEAIEWIKDNENSYKQEEKITISLYEQFVYYCKNLPGKCFLDRKLATTNEKVFKKFINSFEKVKNAKVIVETENHGGEYFYIVEEVVEN